MPRLMSFAMTPNAIRERRKTVTRRRRWEFLEPGDELIAVDRSPRSGKGYEELARIRVVSVRREPLSKLWEHPLYGRAEAIMEGFPEMGGRDFYYAFLSNLGGSRFQEVTRIEFEYVEED